MTVKGMLQVAVSLLHLSLFCQPPLSPSPLYILKCCLQVSEGHHQKKMFSGDTCQKEIAYGCISTALFFLQRQPIMF